jgi:hypothetical protein
MTELKVDRDRVIEASKKCPDAKRILETLFPEIVDTKYVDVSKEQIGYGSMIEIVNAAAPEFRDRAFFLSPLFNWELRNIIYNDYILIPTRKLV